MLLLILIIVVVGFLEIVKLVGGYSLVFWDIMVLGVVVFVVSVFLCIYVFMRLVESIGMLLFVIYWLVLGVFLFVFVGLN